MPPQCSPTGRLRPVVIDRTGGRGCCLPMLPARRDRRRCRRCPARDWGSPNLRPWTQEPLGNGLPRPAPHQGSRADGIERESRGVTVTHDRRIRPTVSHVHPQCRYRRPAGLTPRRKALSSWGFTTLSSERVNVACGLTDLATVGRPGASRRVPRPDPPSPPIGSHRGC